MMQQPDRKEFEAAMYKEVKHMFDNKVWEKVARKDMENLLQAAKKARHQHQKKTTHVNMAIQKKVPC
eukprot:9980785-Ditylum_brightwellii.AAC.1